MEGLRDDPRAPGCERLSDAELYLVRQGVYRIVYEIHDERIVDEVIRVGHRDKARTRSANRWWMGRTFRSTVFNERNARSTLAKAL